MVDRHPQGFLAAPIGSIALRYTTGSMYQKLAGGYTQFGWYLIQPQQSYQQLGTVARGASGATFFQGINGPGATINPTTILPNPFTSGTGLPWLLGKQWMGGYTSAALNNNFIYAPTTINGHPTNVNGGGAVIADSIPWDATWEIVTTPRGSNVGTTTTLADVRIWAGVLNQNNVLQGSGALGTTDLIYTAFVSSMAVASGSYGAMFRFSTVAGDAGWVLCTANDNNAVAAQTVTPGLGAIAADTLYKFRLRFQFVAGVPTIFASINDGTETIVTANVGPGAIPAAVTTTRLVPYIGIRNTSGANLRSLAASEMNMSFGLGCEA